MVCRECGGLRSAPRALPVTESAAGHGGPALPVRKSATGRDGPMLPPELGEMDPPAAPAPGRPRCKAAVTSAWAWETLDEPPSRPRDRDTPSSPSPEDRARPWDSPSPPCVRGLGVTAAPATVDRLAVRAAPTKASRQYRNDAPPLGMATVGVTRLGPVGQGHADTIPRTVASSLATRLWRFARPASRTR
jgi:hypothetical protein